MRILKVSFRNFGSYGNKLHTLEIPEEPSFHLIQGKNGFGKCFLPSTKILILASSDEEYEKFQEFLRLCRSKE